MPPDHLRPGSPGGIGIEPGDWPQILVEFYDHDSAERFAAEQLRPALGEAQRADLINRWFFIRKNPHWRLRYRPAHGTDDSARAHLAHVLDGAGSVVTWASGIYEPETVAFGGRPAMTVAHEVFCQDSRHVLDYLAPSTRGTAADTRPGRHELALLLCSALMRGARQDWYEQGDVWARVAEHRPPQPPAPPRERASALRAAAHRLMTVDTSPTGALAGGALSPYASWLAAFDHAGSQLAALACRGDLERGLRAVLTHHVIFHFNRLGLPATDQSALARLAREVVMTDQDAAATPPRRNAASPASLGAVTATSTDHATTESAEALRNTLVDTLLSRGTVHSGPVESAMRAVPRHLFLPGVPLQQAYADDPVYTKHDSTGVSLSAASQPAIVAMMLEQLQAEPGQRVLEVGAGTGYNAGLLAHLVGTGGLVTTVDVDADLVEGARAGLRRAGYGAVRVQHSDGATGVPGGAPYDRIIATVGAWDLPHAWLDQLAAGGRLVVPLRLRGSVSRSVVLERDGDRWVSRSSEMCTFMPLRGGIADDPRQVVALTPDLDVTLQVHQDQDVDRVALSAALDQPRTEAWTGALFEGAESFEWLDLWLACSLSNGLSRMPVRRSAVDTGLLTPQFGWGAMATFDDDSLAYLTSRPTAPAGTAGRKHEVGVVGHGPGGERLAGQVADAVRAWDEDYRTRHVEITIQPADEVATGSGQFVFKTPHNELAVSWR